MAVDYPATILAIIAPGQGQFRNDDWAGATLPGKVATYAYDPMGRRKSKTVNGVTTSYLHDRDREIAEYDGAGVLLRRYVYGVGLDEPLLQITRTGTKFYYRADGLGSIVANEEHSTSFAQRFTYGFFGETAAATGHPYRYTARRIDEETGLYYYRARMYSPALGRFMQADPIGYAGGINLYAYVGNDPLNLTDPMGLFPVAMVAAGLIGGVANMAVTYISNPNASATDYAISFTAGAVMGASFNVAGLSARAAVALGNGGVARVAGEIATGSAQSFIANTSTQLINQARGAQEGWNSTGTLAALGVGGIGNPIKLSLAGANITARTLGYGTAGDIGMQAFNAANGLVSRVGIAGAMRGVSGDSAAAFAPSGLMPSGSISNSPELSMPSYNGLK